MDIATLIAADRLSDGDVSAARDALSQAGLTPAAPAWVEPGVACDLGFDGSPQAARSVLEGLLPGVDVIVQWAGARAKRLLIADMDSTMISIECIDELADYAGLKDHVATVTERAMRGEIAFEPALRERVALLEGLDADVIERCYAERVRVTPGANALVRTMRREGAYCLLVSGGFTAIADRVANAIGFDRAIANDLGIADGKLSGMVNGDIVGAATKRTALIEAAVERGLDRRDVLAIGDGANDIPMIELAGLGVAYRAKPKVAVAAGARLDHCDLSALLYAQGYPRSAWEAD